VLAKGGLRRMFLHAWKLSFVHPSTGEPLAVESQLPSDLASYVAQLGGVAGHRRVGARSAG
jgi:23S rRNA pseudouridine955/2504/2580 synthase